MSTQPTFAPKLIQENRPARRGPLLDTGSHIAVVGAGAFGGWTALWLLWSGFRVTLIDAWGPGNSRASSGDETRVIRSTYGANETYFNLNVRAIELWREQQQRWNKPLFFNSGVLWFCYEEAPEMIEATQPFMKKHGMEYMYLTPKEAVTRYPHINTNDLHHLVLDPYGGYLKARESCQAVNEVFVRGGGTYLTKWAKPNALVNGRLESLTLSDATEFKADAYVFACGPWLGKLFPALLGDIITCTKQEAYYLGVPPEYTHLFDAMPAWIDLDGEDFYYGIPGNAYRGFKIGVDKRGESFDPTAGERIFNETVLAKARAFMAHRFPALQQAPLVESRVCPYENSPDGNFILDTHPEADNCWFLGGGSGHGFKHGPALGELAAEVISGKRDLEELFRMR
ncbi:NAD(P)/FAD-dependent oxidoreductase [Runella slithyformis]|uniref:Sarcosine oxidase n=1 Tax=Runella slithyformis (strain ATCC 29530 / DSM 19594 / LMG 11500 / NCIMB 11436 / LSU 4) TaxID=761193 RepID=A0A7U3ZHH8_RUNSL|nr:FAD-dependent oxidoreductase [Runella slithyformis]AEI47286.1 Sarcosine oxidase [Runella slithyformis DSM 19594]